MIESHWAPLLATNVPTVYVLLLSGGCSLSVALWRLTMESEAQPDPRRVLWSWWTAAVLCAMWWSVQLRLGGPGVGLDQPLAQALARDTQALVLQAFAWITHLADTRTIVVLGILVAGVLLWRRRWAWCAAWVAALAGNGVLNVSLKAVFERARPLHEHGYAIEHGWSFPSGHSSGAMVFWGMLAWMALRLTPSRWHGLIIAGVTALILTIGFSRVVLQVHYVSDVAAGFCSGFAWLLLCILAVHSWEQGREPQSVRG